MSKEIVLPGTRVADNPVRCEGCFTEDGKTFTSVVSILQDGKVIPLKGKYIPRVGDAVVGIVSDVRFTSFEVDLNSPYVGNISTKDTRTEFELGDVLVAKTRMVDEVHEATLVEPVQLSGGRLIEFEPVKVPRIIGRSNSMLSMLKAYSKSDIVVGKNGRAYIKNGDVALAASAILKICHEAHVAGLTDRMKVFLEQKSGLSLSPEEIAAFEEKSELPGQDFETRERLPFREDRPFRERPFGGGGRFSDRGPPRGDQGFGGPRRRGPPRDY